MTYFDNAATTYPKPPSVVKAVEEAMLYYGANPGRSGHTLSLKTAGKVFGCRQALADFFHAGVEDVVFTSNCTGALNLAIKGTLKSGDHVIISDLEHNSVLRPVHALAQRGVITYSVAKVAEGDPSKTVENFERLVQGNTRMIACTHGSNLTGVLLPIQELGELCREKELLFLVDGAQSAGVVPIDVTGWNIDFLCMPGHKGLYGPSGTGVLIAPRGDLIAPMFEGGTGSYSLDYNQPEIMPDKLESGTVNTAGIIGLWEGVKFLEEKGLSQVYDHEFELISAAYEGLFLTDGVILYTQRPKKGYHLPVLCFNIEGLSSEEATEKLNDLGFALRGGFHCAPLTHQKLNTLEIGAVRASFSMFNKREEVNAFLKAVEKISKSRP